MNQKLKVLVERIPGLNQDTIEKTIFTYKTQIELDPLLDLQEKILQRHTLLNVSDSKSDNNPELMIRKGKLLHRSNYDTETMDLILQTKEKVERMFPAELYQVFHRVCTSKEVLIKEDLNRLRAWFDTVGFQVIPKKAADITTAISTMEQQTELEILFRFNTFPFSVTDFKTYISPASSSYYRAVHYHIGIGKICVEIQFRTPAIDQWSRMHHATHYKPIVVTNQEEKNLVMEFGFIANWVDFKALA